MLNRIAGAAKSKLLNYDHMDIIVLLPTDKSKHDGHAQEDNFGQANFWGAEGCLSADGTSYYYLCRVHHSIAVFNVDPENGQLSFAKPMDSLRTPMRGTLCWIQAVSIFLLQVRTLIVWNAFELTLVDTQYGPSAADVAVI